jgi:hypothetical protein
MDGAGRTAVSAEARELVRRSGLLLTDRAEPLRHSERHCAVRRTGAPAVELSVRGPVTGCSVRAASTSPSRAGAAPVTAISRTRSHHSAAVRGHGAEEGAAVVRVYRHPLFRPSLGHVLVTLRMNPDTVELEEGFTRDLRGINHLGTGAWR